MDNEQRLAAIDAGASELYEKIRLSGSVDGSIRQFRSCDGFEEVLVGALERMHSEQSDLQGKIDDIKERIASLRPSDPRFHAKSTQIGADLWGLVE